jgi:hypothetical protein
MLNNLKLLALFILLLDIIVVTTKCNHSAYDVSNDLDLVEKILQFDLNNQNVDKRKVQKRRRTHKIRRIFIGKRKLKY